MISIIVPVYNVEKYLRKCLDSILSQTYSDFELLLIDDGSKDQSGVICDEYAVKDSRIRVFHKENGGVSSARNLGIEQAKGEWITFIDSDDWVDADYLANFTMDSDLCVQGYYCGERLCRYDDDYVESHVGAIYMKRGYVQGPYCKLFMVSIILNNQIRFDEKLSYGEDILFLMQYSLCSQSMRVTSACSYHYQQAVANSLSMRKRSFEEVSLQYQKHLPVFIELMRGYPHDKKEVRGFLKGAFCQMMDEFDKSCSELLKVELYNRCFYRYFNLFDRYLYLHYPKMAVRVLIVEWKIKRHLKTFVKI